MYILPFLVTASFAVIGAIWFCVDFWRNRNHVRDRHTPSSFGCPPEDVGSSCHAGHTAGDLGSCDVGGGWDFHF